MESIKLPVSSMATGVQAGGGPLPFNLTDLDRKILSQTDEEYEPHSWEELKRIIGTFGQSRGLPTKQVLTSCTAANDLHLFKRSPSELRKYLQWTTAIKAKYGSMVNYISQRRLQWGPTIDEKGSPVVNENLVPRNMAPFADDADYKILRNDWPYGCDPGIHHLVVWMKTKVPVKSEDGNLTPESAALIEEFVRRKFEMPLTHDWRQDGQQSNRVLWFKNWTALQSVAALEHFHVLVRDVSDEMLFSWTGEVGSKREELSN